MKLKSICKSYVSILLTLCILFSMTTVGFTTVSAATPSEPVGGLTSIVIDKMLDIGLRVACEGVVAVSEATAEKGYDGISKTTALIAEWGLMSAEEAAVTKNIELCEQILSELQSLTATTEKGLQNIQTDIAKLGADLSIDELYARQSEDINQVISDIKTTNGVLDYYDEYVKVASKYKDGSATRDDVIDAQYKFLFALRNYAGITANFKGNTTEELLAAVSKQLFGDEKNADLINQLIEKIIGTLSVNLIIEPGTHPENVMSEAMTLAANYYPFSHQQYIFVLQQVGLQIHTIVKILTMYNEILALQYGYLQTQKSTGSDVSALLTTYGAHVSNFNINLIPGVTNNINTMFSTKYSLTGAGIKMGIDDYMKPEDAVATNLKVSNYVHNYYANGIWGEYHSYHKLMTTTNGNKNNVYYLLNDARGLADLYDYTYSNPDFGVCYENIIGDINDGYNTFSLPNVTDGYVNYDNLFGTNAFPLRNCLIRSYFYDFDKYGATYPLISQKSPLYLLTNHYTIKHGHIDKTYVVNVDANQTASNLIKTEGFTPSDDPTNRDYSTYFTTVFSPTDVYKQRVTAEVSGMSGVEMQIVTQDSANQEITITNGSSAVVPSGNTLVIKMKIPESAGAVSLSCIRDHDAFGDSTSDPSIEIFDEDLLDYITVENGYYVFTCPMPYSQCTFKLHVDAADENGNFIIENYEDLCNMVNLVNSGNKKYTKGNFILTNDIDCPQESIWTTSIGQTDLYYNADPESNGNWGFGGTFDGNGHVIRNLTVRGSTKVDASFGLFGTVSGTVKNLGIENFTYKGATKDSRVGAIAGQILNGGKIENCYVINGNINTKVLTTSGVAGGIAGANYSGSIENCYVYNSTISAARAGGIVGDNYGDGNNADGTDRPGTIKNCYTTSDRICERGTATGSKASVSAEIYASGEIAYLLNSGTVNGTQTWYQNLDNGLTPEAYPVLVSNGNNTVYKVDSPDKKYSNFNSDKLDKDENGNFIIKTYDDLCLMAVRVNSGSDEYVNGSYVLANNIIIPENEHWTSTIGNNEIPFCGTFDGQGYSISGLTITNVSSNTVGLFGALKGATVKNTHLKDVNIDFVTHSFSPAFDGPDTVTGALCGKAYLSSVISNCTTSGKIKAEGALQVSGMCGYLTYSNIDNCINYCDIESNSEYVGGLIGAINQEVNINNCANLGDITCDGTVYCGGIISSGITSTSVNNCYNTGKINGTFTDLGNKYHIGPIRGDKNPETNCYVLDNNTQYSTLSKICTLEEFTCGEVTFLLNKGVTDGTQAWYQNLDNDELPNLLPTLTNNGKNTVYTIPSQKGYSNYQHNDKASVLERVDLRTYQRVINPDGTFSEDSKFYYGFGLVNNDSKEITLFVLDTAQRIGILRHQGRDENHTAGEMVLLGDYPKLNITSKELLESGQEEPDIYTDKNHCIFIKIPENGEIPPIKVKYTEKPTSDFTPTEYTLKIKVVDSSYLKTVGASRTSVLSEDDLNYAVYESEQAYANALKASPQQPTNSTKDPSKNGITNSTTIKTGSTFNCALALLVFFAALAFILVYKRKHKVI